MPVIRIENHRINPYMPDVIWRAEMRGELAVACLEAKVAGITERQHLTIVFGQEYEEGDEVSVMDDGTTEIACNNPKMAVIVVEGLFERPDRTVEDRRRLATTLGLALHRLLPVEWGVEVIIRSYAAQSEGFVSIAADGTVCPA